MEEKQPVAPPLRRALPQAQAEIRDTRDKNAAGRVGNGPGVIAGPAVGQDDIAHNAARYTRHQSGQGRNERTLRVVGGNDDRNQCCNGPNIA